MLEPLKPDVEENELSEESRLRDENRQLQAQVEKLNKINQVLMRRVELGWGNHSDAYQSFESAALLSDKVRESKMRLKQTMGKLIAANMEVSRAQKESEQARQRLADSVESIFDAFALFDPNGLIMLANSRFYELWSHNDFKFELGVTRLRSLVEYSLERGIFTPESDSPTFARIAPHGFGNSIYQLKSGRWVQTTERATADGGLVLTFTDITLLKNSETRQRELALEEQTNILQSTINNMSQGVALVDANCQLLAWNTRFLEISRLLPEQVSLRMDFHQLISTSELYFGSEIDTAQLLKSQQKMLETEKVLSDGSVILIRHHLVPGGGFVNTYTDITDRSLQQKALQESERRIRLITDAVPALISYIDKDLNYQFANLQFESWFQTSRELVIGKSMRDVLGEEGFAKIYQYVKSALDGEVVEFELEEKEQHKKRRISQKTYVPHYDNENRVIGFFALEQDVTRQRRTREALKEAYDNLEERVYERTRQITEVNDKLKDEINERRLIEKSLLTAKREAEEANLSKIKFLAATSHDLLQPLNAACLFASSLEQRELPEETHHLVKSLGYSLKNIESLISSLVDISKLDAGVVEPEMEFFKANELLDNIANEFHQQNEGGKIQLHYIKSSAMIHTDSQLLARILRNFLTNAFRYTRSGRVILGARRRSGGLEIQVIDSGSGISESDCVQIFEEFHRGQHHSSRDDQGLGLGLAIVDKISRILELKVNVQSVLDKGSCFSMLIPYASAQAQSRMNVPAIPDMPADLPPQCQHILVIDNDESICLGMQTLLNDWGCVVSTLQTNPQIDSVIENGFSEKPDLIIADYHLDEGVTGLDVVTNINQQQSQPIPVLLITANYTSDLRQQAREQGYHLMNKPVKPVKLKLAINHLFQMSAQGLNV